MGERPGPGGSRSWLKCSPLRRPHSATTATWPTMGTRRSSSTPSGTSTASAAWPPSWVCASPTSPRPTCTTTTSPEGWPSLRRPEPAIWSMPPIRSALTGPRAGTAPRPLPARSTPRPTAWPASCPTPRRSTRRTGSAASAPPRRRRPSRPRSGGRSNSIPRSASEQMYVDTLLAGLDAWPAYYAHMGPANTAGPAGPDLSPPRRANAAEVRRAIEAGEWVVDLRDRVAFAAGFVPGSFSFPLDGSFATYLGWVIPWGTPVTLLGETPEQVSKAQRELVRIGIDRPAAAATGQPQDWAGGAPLATLRLAKFGDLAASTTAARGRSGELAVLDVRRQLEWEDSHIAGAAHIPFSELLGQLHEVPPGEVWVHCHSGYRSIVAASMLAAHGCRAISIDDDYANAGTAGLPLVRP